MQFFIYRKLSLSRQTWLAMKLVILFMVIGLMQVSAKSNAQYVTISGQDISLKKVFREINKQTGYVFFYDITLLRKAKSVTIHVKDAPVQTVLNDVFKDQPLTWSVENNTVTIINKPDTVSEISHEIMNDLPPPISIHGIVKDEKGKPLDRVSVIVKGSKNGTATNSKGEYELENVDDNAVLTFSIVGYMSQSISVNSRSTINIFLSLKLLQQSEVVVVGYGTQSAVDVTGAVSSINSKEISQDHSVINATDMLEGRIPGLNVLKTGGAPGSGSDLYVRGLSTFNNTSPLIVVDGIPGRSLDNINPNDISSISVLKDAASVAVYGARGANGVILVTTKKGAIGKPEITFSSNLINQRPTQIYKQLNSYQYVTLYNEALQNEGNFNPAIGSGWTDDQIQKFKDGSDPNNYPNTDWYKQLISPSILQSSYNLSASGGTENTRYFISCGYVKDNGIVPVEGYQRYNLRGNITSTIAHNLKLNMDIAGIYTESHGEAVYGSQYVISQVYGTPPIRVNKFTNGTYAYVPEQRGSAAQQALGQTGFNNNDNNIFNSNLSLTYDIPWVKGLSVKGLMAYDKTMSFGKDFAKPTNMYSLDASGNYSLVPAYPTSPYLRESYSQDYLLTLQGSLNYENFFGGNHITGLLLYEQSQESADNFTTQRSNFVSSSLAELSLGDPTRVSNSGTGSESARQGIVSRVTYGFEDKYLAEFNFRYDGSDIFPPGHRFGFFPSLSAGWVLSKESFFKNILPNINFLKIRGSWGQLGNDQVSPFQFLSTYSLVGGDYNGGGYTFGGTDPNYYQSLNPNVLPNPNFTWERAVMTNIGLDAHLWGDLLGISADYFKKRTKDILAPPSGLIPDVIGSSLPDQNSGIVDNSGFEIELTHSNHIGKFSYYISPNVSFNHNKVVYFPESSSIPQWQKVTGKSIAFDPVYGVSAQANPYLGEIGYHSLGLYQTAEQVVKGPTPPFSNVEPGDIAYADINKDGQITANDEEVLDAHFFPGVQYGIKWGCSYGGIELNVLMQGAANVDAYTISGNGVYTPTTAMLDHWTPQNPNASFPRLFINYQNNQQTSDYWIKNTSYLRVKNVELGYHLPEPWLKKIGAKEVLVTVGGNNLLTFTKFKLFDPESAGSRIIDPLMKSYTASLTLSF